MNLQPSEQEILLDEILIAPSNEIKTERFSSESSEATCKPDGWCSGSCG